MTLFDTHRPFLYAALTALQQRGHWSAFPEHPGAATPGIDGREAGTAAAERWLGQRFPIGQAGARGWCGNEQSPYGFALGVQYPDCDAEALLSAAQAALPAWQAAGPQVRTGVLLEALQRLHRRSHEIAHAVQLTTGQGPAMAFQAGAAHAQDRALEALAVAWTAMAGVPATALWEKPLGRHPYQETS